METLYIIIGAFSSIFVFLLGYSVSGVFTGKKRIDGLQHHIESAIQSIEYLIESNEKDRNIVQVDIYKSLERLTDDDDDIKSLLDSRLDKLENKLTGLIPPTNDELLKRIEKIEEESYRLRMNL